MALPVPDELAAQLIAMGDQVQQCMQASTLECLGFIVLVKHGDGLTAEARSLLTPGQFDGLLRHYLDGTPSAG